MENQVVRDRNRIESQGVEIKEKISYGAGDAAYALSVSTVVSFAMFYFTEVVGVAAAALGTVLFFTRIIDAITNILMGHVVDLTKTKHGKARPWILWMIIPMAVVLIALFTVPSNMSSTATLVYIVILYNLYYLIYTMSNIPYGTLGTLISQESDVRSELNLLRMIGYFGLTIIIGAATVPLINAFGGGQRGFTITMTIYALIMSVLFLIVFFNTKERVVQKEPERKEDKLTFFKSFQLLLKNKYWLMIFLIMILAWILVDLFQGVNVYYAEYILGDANLVGILSGLYTGALVFGFFIVNIPIRKYGRKPTIMAGLGVIILSSLILAFNPSSLVLVSIATALRGLSFSPLMGTAYAMLADTIEYGEWKNGIRNEGMTYSGGTFSTTFGSGVASAAIGWLLGFSGYISGGASAQPASVYTMIQFLFIYAPIIVGVVLLIVFYFYDLDNIYDKIVGDLREKNK